MRKSNILSSVIFIVIAVIIFKNIIPVLLIGGGILFLGSFLKNNVLGRKEYETLFENQNYNEVYEEANNRTYGTNKSNSSNIDDGPVSVNDAEFFEKKHEVYDVTFEEEN